MAKFFNTNGASKREIYERRYKAARSNILLILIMTVVNIGLLVAGTDRYFLFSASLPYYFTFMGMFMSGLLPDYYYEGEFENIIFYDTNYFTIAIIISAAIILLYLIGWIFSNKHRVGWLIFTLILTVIDTISMFLIYGVTLDIGIDILFHIWFIYYIVSGITAHYSLKKLPPEEVAAEGTDAFEVAQAVDSFDGEKTGYDAFTEEGEASQDSVKGDSFGEEDG